MRVLATSSVVMALILLFDECSVQPKTKHVGQKCIALLTTLFQRSSDALYPS